MRFSKMFLATALVLGAVLMLFTSVAAQSDSEDPEVVIVLFWSQNCSHCAKEKPVLEGLAQQYPQVKLGMYEVSQDSSNLEYLYAMGAAMDFEVSGVPVTIIGDQVWVGYNESISAEIEEAVVNCLPSGCPDPMAKIGVGDSMVVEAEPTEVITEADTAGAIVEAKETDVVAEDVTKDVEESPSVFSWLIPAAAVVLLAIGLSIYFGNKNDKKTSKKS